MNSETHSTTPPKSLVIASRESRLAMWQAEHVRCALHKLYPSCDVKILGMTTRGDQILDRTLSKVGGKGLFVKELEAALAEGRADLAVHSLKDVPMELPDGFALSTILEREDPRDAFVSSQYACSGGVAGRQHRGHVEPAPRGHAAHAFSASRRASAARQSRHAARQARSRRLRGDHPRRGRFEAARAGSAHPRAARSPTKALPAAGQGALGIEIRADRADLAAWLAPLHHPQTAAAVEAERMVSRSLGGSCEVPLAAYATWHDGTLHLRGCVATPDGQRVLSSRRHRRPRRTSKARWNWAGAFPPISKRRARWRSCARFPRQAARACRPPRRPPPDDERASCNRQSSPGRSASPPRCSRVSPQTASTRSNSP